MRTRYNNADISITINDVHSLSTYILFFDNAHHFTRCTAYDDDDDDKMLTAPAT